MNETTPETRDAEALEKTVAESSAVKVVPRARGFRKVAYSSYVLLLGIWKFIVGAALTQTLLGSVIVSGWIYRATQRAIQKQWWRMSPLRDDRCFCEFTALSAFHRGLGGWPNWLMENNREWMRVHEGPGKGRVGRYLKAFFHSIWLNVKYGVQSCFNSSVMVMPGCALMLFSWYAGWLNSFNKGYEQALIGPLTGISGIICFIVAMYYVPMAQARQASTGNWRSFYQFKTVWQCVRKRWLESLGLAVLYAGLAVPFTIIKSAPTFFSSNPNLTQSAAQELHFAKLYYFLTAFILLGACLMLRLLAGKIYASAVVGCVQSGALHEDALTENEWETLHRLDLLTIRPEKKRHFLVKTITWCGTKLGRVTVGFALFLVWFLFVGQVYVSEFVLKSEFGRGWLNQPYVQLPWFNYIPGELRKEGNR